MIGLEVEGLFQSPQDVAPFVQIEPMIGSGSLVVNVLNASRMSVYAVGGYSRLDFGNSSPYRFTDGGVHGGAGAKVFMSSRFALRPEGREICAHPTIPSFGPKIPRHLVAGAGVAFLHPGAPPCPPPSVK